MRSEAVKKISKEKKSPICKSFEAFQGFVELFLELESSQNISGWKGPVRIIMSCCSQDDLKLNHMAKSIILMLFELRQAPTVVQEL